VSAPLSTEASKVSPPHRTAEVGGPGAIELSAE